MKMLCRLIQMFALVALCGASAAMADETDSMIGVNLKSGLSQTSGDLSHQKKLETHGFQVVLYQSEAWRKYSRETSSVSKALGGYEWRLQVDFDSTEARQDGEYFLVPPGEQVELDSFDLVSQFCVLTNFPVQLCPYFGIGQATARDAEDNGKRYTSTDATFPYGVIISSDWPLYDNYRLLVGMQYGAYDIEQTVNEKRLSYRVVSAQAYLGVGF